MWCREEKLDASHYKGLGGFKNFEKARFLQAAALQLIRTRIFSKLTNTDKMFFFLIFVPRN